MMRKRTIALWSLLAVVLAGVALFFVLNMTNPSDGGPAVILVVLMLIYGLSYGFILLSALSLWYIYHLIAPRQRTTTTSGERLRHQTKRLLAICAVLAATPILVISLNSIGQLGFVDMSLIVATEALAVFYISRKM